MTVTVNPQNGGPLVGLVPNLTAIAFSFQVAASDANPSEALTW